MASRIINKIPLTLIRTDPSTGYYQGGNYIKGTTSEIGIRCSIQPFRKGDTQMTLPEGLRAEDVVMIYTKSPVQTVDQFEGAVADTTTIDNLVYVAINVENWNRQGMRSDHFKAMFVREDKAKNGRL